MSQPKTLETPFGKITFSLKRGADGIERLRCQMIAWSGGMDLRFAEDDQAARALKGMDQDCANALAEAMSAKGGRVAKH